MRGKEKTRNSQQRGVIRRVDGWGGEGIEKKGLLTSTIRFVIVKRLLQFVLQAVYFVRESGLVDLDEEGGRRNG